jgi:hypothetical protein
MQASAERAAPVHASSTPHAAHAAWIPAVVALLAFVAATVWLCGLTGDAAANMLLPYLAEAWRNGTIALIWWLGAVGLGLGIVRLTLARGGSTAGVGSSAGTGGGAGGGEGGGTHRTAVDRTTLDALALATVVGASAMLAIDNLLGTLGLLRAGGGAVAWGIPLAAGIVGIRILRNAPIARDQPLPTPTLARATFAAVHGVLAALILVAATAAPGWLWASEFGGYDAQSYHLPLAIAWTAPGATVGPVEGNVYAALPSFVESAFTHLLILRGDAIPASIACQWWAAFATLLGAFVVARLARRLLGASAAPIASAATLATPWVVVVGTLAYNDGILVLALAGGWLLIEMTVRERASDRGRERALDLPAAALLALIAAAATGAKPTAFFFVALPLAAIAILRTSPATLRFVPLAAGIGLAVLGAWLVRNGLAFGNPVFPFAEPLLGPGPWSAEQHAIFARAHGPDAPILARPALLWSEWIAYGFSGSARPFPQWSALPALGLAGLALAARRAAWARAGLVATVVIVLGWLLLTHLESRFLLATVVARARGGGGGVGRARGRPTPGGAVDPRIGAVAVALLAVAPLANYLREPDKQRGPNMPPLRAPSLSIGSIPVQTGDVAAKLLADAAAAGNAEMQATILRQATTPFAMNHLLPADARVVGIGYATPFYVRRPMTTTTVWDRGPIDEVAERAPDAPESWGSLLRQRGFTHALVDPTMLQNWATRGWLNPRIAKADWVEAFGRSNRMLARTTDGKILFELAP